MKWKFYLILTIFLARMDWLSAQKEIPRDYFRSPLNIDLLVTGAFGEIRSNHFHSGVDFSVQKKEGLPVFAIADGFVSRIKISPVGFGNALYIDHPNGFTSVYGHLMQYNDTVRSYARNSQYRMKSFEVDLFPANRKDTILVKSGDIIGYAGNSGTSFGPHLHFEIRNTATERIINPLLFGYKATDNYPPEIDFLKIYPYDDASFLSGSAQAMKVTLWKDPSGEFRLVQGDTLSAWGRFSVGIQAFDFLYNKSDRNGWYSLKMYFDKAAFFSFQVDSFAFDETRYVNASIDYADNYLTGSSILYSKRMPANKLSLHQSVKDNGILTLRDGKVHEVVIAVSDLAGNKTVVRFWMKSVMPERLAAVPQTESADTLVFVPYARASRFETPEIRIEFPAECLYEDTWLLYNRRGEVAGTYSVVHELHKPTVPVHRKIKISLSADNLPENLRSKAMLVRIDREGKRYPVAARYREGFVTGEISNFDRYAIAVDQAPPVISHIQEKSKHPKRIRYRVTDNFSGIDKYTGEVNGEWVLVEWDPKNKLMVYNYDDKLKPGKNQFTLRVSDEKGNEAKVTRQILK